jgi:hypothetical protein
MGDFACDMQRPPRQHCMEPPFAIATRTAALSRALPGGIATDHLGRLPALGWAAWRAHRARHAHRQGDVVAFPQRPPRDGGDNDAGGNPAA